MAGVLYVSAVNVWFFSCCDLCRTDCSRHQYSVKCDNMILRECSFISEETGGAKEQYGEPTQEKALPRGVQKSIPYFT